MNLRLPVLVGMVVLGMAMVAVAGSDNAKNIVGVWQQSKDPLAVAWEQTWEYTKDGKLKLTGKSTAGDTVVLDGTYKLKDDTLTNVLRVPAGFDRKLNQIIFKDEEWTFKIVKLDEKVLHAEEIRGDKKSGVVEFKRVTAK